MNYLYPWNVLYRCLILPQLMPQLIHLLLWVVRNHWHQLIGGLFMCSTQVFFFYHIMFHYLFDGASFHFCGTDWFGTLNIFLEINCMGFCEGWSSQMGGSGLISYTRLPLQFKIRNYTDIMYPFLIMSDSYSLNLLESKG